MALEREIRMIDIHGVDVGIQIEINRAADGAEVWINVDGVCRLRAKGLKASDVEIILNGESI